MSAHCYTFQTSRGTVRMQYSEALTEGGQKEAADLAEFLASKVPEMTPEDEAKQLAAREKWRARRAAIRAGSES